MGLSLSNNSNCAGAVCGLMGAKLVYDIRHCRLSVLQQACMDCTSDDLEPPGSGRASEVTTESGSLSNKLSYAECAKHVVCAAAACAMPTHPW